jgi:hypothetical protein
VQANAKVKSFIQRPTAIGKTGKRQEHFDNQNTGNQTTINALSFLLLSKLTRPHHPGFSCYDTMIIDAMNVIMIRVDAQ